MLTRVGQIKDLIEELSNFIREIRNKKTRESTRFILDRLENAMRCLETGKDLSSQSCSRSRVGEYLLKTWRIAREPKYFITVRGNINKRDNSYSIICDNIRKEAKSLLGDKYRDLYELEKSSYRICSYLMKASAAFRSMGEFSESLGLKKKMFSISFRFEGLAYQIYNAFNLMGRFVSWREIISEVRELKEWIANEDFGEEFSCFSDDEIEEIEIVCDRFNSVLSPYIKRYAILDRDIGDDEDYSSPGKTRIKKQTTDRQKAMDNMGGVLEQMILRKDQMAKEGLTPVVQSPKEESPPLEMPVEIRDSEPVSKVAEEPPMPDIDFQTHEESELIEALKMVFFISPLKEEVETPATRWEAEIRKRMEIEKALRRRYIFIGVQIFIVLTFLAFVASRVGWLKNIFGGTSHEKAPRALSTLEAGAGSQAISGHKVIVVGKLRFEKKMKLATRKDGKYYIPDLRLICYFPEIYYQCEFNEKDLIVEKSGDFRLLVNLPDLKESGKPEKVRLTCKYSGHKEFNTKFIPLRGDPPTAYIPDIVLKRKD